MIYLYTGTPGSGKSLHTASIIYWTLRRHKPIIANFNIALEKIKGAREKDFTCLSNTKITPKFLREYSREYFSKHRFKEGAITLILDECQLMFNAREWNVKGRADWNAFFTNHRKYGFDIILIAQFDRMLDRQIRSLVEYMVIHRKMSNFGFKGKVISGACGGNLFVSVTVWYPLKEKVGQSFFKAKKKYYSIYDTNFVFDEDE